MTVVPPARGHCNTVEDEFWYHVSPQHGLPIASGATTPANLDRVSGFLTTLEQAIECGLKAHVAAHLVADPESLKGMRLLSGLSDKRLYLDLSYRLSRVERADGLSSICGCDPHDLTRHSTAFFINLLKTSSVRDQLADELADYLTTAGLERLAIALIALEPQQRQDLVMNFVASKEAQQSEAKRRGHGAEAALAVLLEDLGVTFVPFDKATNPMGAHDPNFNAAEWELCDREVGATYSADLAITTGDGTLIACVQGLIHSSDPGQFGVDKSNQTVEIRQILDGTGNGQLWGLLDGVGYSENKSGTINKLLQACHVFGQINSLYKFGLACHEAKLVEVKAISFNAGYSAKALAGMSNRYVPGDVEIIQTPSERPELVPVGAGWATLLL